MHRARFNAGAAAAFPEGSAVAVFMLDGDSGRATPYSATMARDKLGGVPPDDPFTCAELPTRYEVKWTDGGDDTVSAWEVFPADTDEAAAVAPLKGSSRALAAAARRLAAGCMDAIATVRYVAVREAHPCSFSHFECTLRLRRRRGALLPRCVADCCACGHCSLLLIAGRLAVRGRTAACQGSAPGSTDLMDR